MFGTLAPPRGCAPLPVVRAHRSYYCGTCQSLGEHFGHPRRALLSHDAVFMAILVDALQVEAAAPSRCRCPMMPVAIRSTVDPRSVAMRYAASIQIVLADQWLADRAADGGRLARVVRPWVSREPARLAADSLTSMGADLAGVRAFAGRQVAVERDGHPSPAVAAMPTAAVLSAVFETVADLPGAAPEARTAATREALAELGAGIGTAIYLLDALEDLHDDARSGDFNACTDPDGTPSPQCIEHACAELDRQLTLVARRLAEIPWRRNAELLRAIVLRQLAPRCRRAMTAARDLLSREAQAALARWRALSPPRRAMLRALAALAFAWTWATTRFTRATAASPSRLVTTRVLALAAGAWTWGSTRLGWAAPGDTDGDEAASFPPDASTGGTSDVADSADLPPDLGMLDLGTPDLGDRLDVPADLGMLDLGTPDLGDGLDVPPDLGTPDLGDGSSTSDADTPTLGCGDPCRECTDCGERSCHGCCDVSLACFEGCGRCTTDCTSCCTDCKPCEGCGSLCPGCGSGECCKDNPCAGCGSACADCGRPCQNCGGACGDCGNGCHCGNGCDRPCDGCGQACQGCGNCGDGCGNGCHGGGGGCCA